MIVTTCTSFGTQIQRIDSTHVNTYLQLPFNQTRHTKSPTHTSHLPTHVTYTHTHQSPTPTRVTYPHTSHLPTHQSPTHTPVTYPHTSHLPNHTNPHHFLFFGFSPLHTTHNKNPPSVDIGNGQTIAGDPHRTAASRHT
jgi:hypothetical protein